MAAAQHRWPQKYLFNGGLVCVQASSAQISYFMMAKKEKTLSPY